QRAGAGRSQARQHPQQARLAGAAGAQHRHHLAPVQHQVDVSEYVGRRSRIAQRQAMRSQHRTRPRAHAAPSAARRAWRLASSVLSCTRSGVTMGRKAASRQRRAKPSPAGFR
ncbi:hypothetical protein OY671_012737, partial [Metschnikowia pulcherrima]